MDLSSSELSETLISKFDSDGLEELGASDWLLKLAVGLPMDSAGLRADFPLTDEVAARIFTRYWTTPVWYVERKAPCARGTYIVAFVTCHTLSHETVTLDVA